MSYWLAGSALALFVFVSILYLAVVGAKRYYNVEQALRIASSTLETAYDAGDIDLVIAYSNLLTEVHGIYDFKVSGKNSENLIGPMGASGWGLIKFCSETSTYRGLNISGCADLYSAGPILNLFLILLLFTFVVGLSIIILNRRSQDSFLLISNELKRIEQLSSGLFVQNESTSKEVEGLEEIRNLRSRMLNLVKQAEEAAAAEAYQQLAQQIAHDLRAPLLALKIKKIVMLYKLWLLSIINLSVIYSQSVLACAWEIRQMQMNAGPKNLLYVLPHIVQLSNGLEFRSSHLTRQKRILVGIPGGPGISSKYLDASILAIAKRIDTEAITINLPNHGRSQILQPNELNFSKAVAYIRDAIFELAGNADEVYILGHSLGATIALELAAQELPQNIRSVSLVSTPVRLNDSKRLDEAIQNAGLSLPNLKTEDDFKKLWRLILPFYFADQMPSDLLDQMAEETYYFASEFFNDGAPTLDDLQKRLESVSTPQLIFVEGTKDLLAPENHAQDLRSKFPQADVIELEKSAHFSMLEQRLDLNRALLARLLRPVDGQP